MFAGLAQAQPQGKVPAKMAAERTLTVTGLVYEKIYEKIGSNLFDGKSNQRYLLKTSDGNIEIVLTEKTCFANFFLSTMDAWGLGAEWNITYHRSNDVSDGFEADTVVYTGNKNPEIKIAENVVAFYRQALTDEDKDYDNAYSMLSEEAQRRLTLADFTKIYEPIKIEYATRKLCSNTKEKVVLMITYDRDNKTLYQLVEIVPSAYTPKISRLYELEEKVAKANAACKALGPATR